MHQLCADTGCRSEDFPKAIADRNGSREREREIESRKSVLLARLDDDDDDDDTLSNKENTFLTFNH